ncbi:hypothetical protein evm_012881 [Chilo suppressalis]|nr:hypothetical protein evm_012881 [Chilo suppressalis]
MSLYIDSYFNNNILILKKKTIFCDINFNTFQQSITEAVETPTTSANDVKLSLRREGIIDEELLLPPPLPTAGTSRQDTSAAAGTIPPPSNSATNASRRRSQRLLSRSVDAEMDRMACIEERRVEAKRLTAEAFANTSRSFDRLANATHS